MVKVLFCFLISFSFAKQWVVSDATEFQSAIDSLKSGDTILLEDGTYYGNFIIEDTLWYFYFLLYSPRAMQYWKYAAFRRWEFSLGINHFT